VRTYVRLSLRPSVMDCTHKEAIHMGNKVTVTCCDGIIGGLEWWIVLSGRDVIHADREKVRRVTSDGH